MNILHRLQHHDPGIDFSYSLREDLSFHPGILNNFTPPAEIASSIDAIAVDSFLGILAVGTSSGCILLFGAHPVTATLKVPKGLGKEGALGGGLKWLGFLTSLKKLVCLDSHNVLHIWNLDPQEDQPRPPQLIISIPFPDQIDAITTSPLHSHIFLATNLGEVVTLDADRLCPSPYIISNLWEEHRQDLRRTGELPPASGKESVPAVMDLVVHPRDLNLLFVAYDGGVVLWNIANKRIERTYHLVLHPGAKGGGNYNETELFMERYPAVTTMAVHPSGHILATGHLDGCISFWAVEDGERPLSVRTVSEPFSFVDVHVPDPFALTDDANAEAPGGEREPIFKLSWSGYPAIKKPADFGATELTTLTILGGGLPLDPNGVIVLVFPGITLPTPDVAAGSTSPKPNGHTMLPPSTRQALKASLFPSETLDSEPLTSFPSSSPVEDFFLIPRSSPFMSGSFDPVAIILLTSNAGARKNTVLSAYEFPPQCQEISSSGKPRLQRARLPFALEMAYTPDQNLVTGASLVKFDSRQVFGTLVSAFVNHGDLHDTYTGSRLTSLRAGSAWSDFDGDDAPDRRLAKYDYHRALITWHKDLTIRIYDLSSQLLLSQSALQFEYPQILPHLTIEVGHVLLPPPAASPLDEDFPDPGSPSGGDASSKFSEGRKILSVILAKQSLDCCVALSDGTVTVWKLKEAGSPTQVYDIPSDDIDTIMPLEPFIRQSDRRKSCFHPLCLIKPPKASLITAVAFNDVGFLAIAYSNESLLVLDLRGPRVLLRKSWVGDKHRLGPAMSLTWSICGMGSDTTDHLRLFASQSNGTTVVYTVEYVPDSQNWSINDSDDATVKLNNAALAKPLGCFVLHGKSGDERTATSTALQQVMEREKDADHTKISKEKQAHCFLVLAGEREARCFENVNGARVGTAEWTAAKDNTRVARVKVVHRNGYQALVAFREDHRAEVYSLPELEFLHVMDLPVVAPAERLIDADSDGDYVSMATSSADGGPPVIVYETLFHMRRPLPPLVDLGEPRLPSVDAIPHPQPAPLTTSASTGSGLGAWIWSNGPKVYKGPEIDSLLAGPNRPPPLPLPKRKTSVRESGPKSPPGVTAASRVSSDGRADVFSRLRNAVTERGEALAQLDETFSALETSSKDMVAQAKRLAAEQTAKQTARGWRPFG